MEDFIRALFLHVSERVPFPDLESPFSLCFHVLLSESQFGNNMDTTKLYVDIVLLTMFKHVDSCLKREVLYIKLFLY